LDLLVSRGRLLHCPVLALFKLLFNQNQRREQNDVPTNQIDQDSDLLKLDKLLQQFVVVRVNKAEQLAFGKQYSGREVIK
jgi:hypothetical protein